MSSYLYIGRRQFLTLPLALLLAPLASAFAETQRRQTAFDADVGILYRTLSFELTGTLEEAVDRAAGRYEVKAVGQGSSIANRIESRGIRRHDRWAPLQATSWFNVAGRESRTEITYDYDARRIQYHFRGETFFLRRQRKADDVLDMPEAHVDDVMSAVFNYADGAWPPEKDGTYRTQVVRRRKSENEGPDDVQPFYRAELVPFLLKVEPDGKTGKPTARFDLTRFSSWARQNQPASIVFSGERRPEVITAPLVLGTSVNIRLKTAA